MKSIMKNLNIIKTALLGLLTLGLAAGCAREPFEEITELNLRRCLEPMNLRAKVNTQVGNVVSFSWDVNKDAESYTLEAYDDAAMTKLNFREEGILPDQVPFEKTLVADLQLYYRVKAVSSKREDSSWAVYDKVIKTFDVKDNLFLTVTAKTMNSVTVSWSKDVEDYLDVDHIEYGAPGADERKSYVLKADEIQAASAIVSGEGDAALVPGTEYEIILFSRTASRGQVNVWTSVDPSALTAVGSLAALNNALETEGAKIFLKLEGSPYALGTKSVTKPVSIYGESAADGSQPVIKGEFEFRAPLTKGSWLFQDVCFDGDNDKYGFVIQLHKSKSDFSGSVAKFDDITFINCYITGYQKGLIYEWDQTYEVNNLVFDSCFIQDVNINSGSGDVIDIRKNGSSFNKIELRNNTIVNGGRTWIRFDKDADNAAKTPVIKSFVFENNTVQGICQAYNEGSYSFGFLGLQMAPTSFTFKKNLFLNLPADSRFGSEKAGYLVANDLGITASDNYYYNAPAGYFTDSYPVGKLGMKKLSVDPCFNSKGGYFNIDPDSDIAGEGIGASRWWTPYAEKPEDLTMPLVDGARVWNFGDASLFTEKIKREMVRNGLYINASDDFVFEAKEGALVFTAASSVNKKNLPLEGYLAFKVNAPGSVLVKPSDPAGKGGHIVVGIGPVDHSSVTIKGGASALADQTNPQKILVKGITEESLVYVWTSAPITLDKLAWSTDVTEVNTALAAPAPKADPAVVTSGDATPVVISWEAVPNAASYSVIFNGKTYDVDEPTYTIPGGTVSMLDPGSHRVEVYANPGADDIYNTESAVGVAAFAVLSAGGDAGVLVVKTVEELYNAIQAGKSEIKLDAGEYDMGTLDLDADGVLDCAPVWTIVSALALEGQGDVTVKGAFKLSGEVGTFSLKNMKLDAKATGKVLKNSSEEVTGYEDVAQAILVDLDKTTGVKTSAITMENLVVENYAKSIIYTTNDADKYDLGQVSFLNSQVNNMGTGQGGFDFRNGVFTKIKIEGNTFNKGFRDFIRADATVTAESIEIRHNTFYGTFAKNGQTGFNVRATCNYVLSYNLIHSIKGTDLWFAPSGRKLPALSHNFYYNCDEVFFTGGIAITEEVAKSGNGVILTEDPCRDAANGDFTLTNMLAQSCGVGAPKWNPGADASASSGTIVVKDTTELNAALDAGKLDITFAAAGNFTFKNAVKVRGNMRFRGETGAKLYNAEFALQGGEESMGTVIFENLDVEGILKDPANPSDGYIDKNFVSVAAVGKADKVIIRNCSVTHLKKSLFYDGTGLTADAVLISNVLAMDLGGGQGTVDLRMSVVKTLTVEDCTFNKGRDFLRADKLSEGGTVTEAVIVRNNLFDGCCLNSGNGILYVRAEVPVYRVYNNLFINENGSNNSLGKASGVKVPEFSNNHYFGCTSTKFWTTLFTEALGTAGSGSILAADPCTDAANGDYTLTNDDLKKADVGPARWNPSAGQLRSHGGRR